MWQNKYSTFSSSKVFKTYRPNLDSLWISGRSAVQQYARAMGLEKLAPHDMRRTCAKL
jgi:hypothetical protein